MNKITYLIDFRNNCPALIDQYDVFGKIIECLEQKQFKQYSVKAEKVESASMSLGSEMHSVFLFRYSISHGLSSFQGRVMKIEG